MRGIALPGGGEPLNWWIAGGRLSSQPIAGAAELPGAWLAPGLVRCARASDVRCPRAARTQRGSEELVAAHLAQQREAGVLAVRDAGSLPRAELPGRPAGGGDVIACGPFLAPPGLYLAQLYEPTPADDVIDCARQRVQAGAEWVKVIVDFPGADAKRARAGTRLSLDLPGAIVEAVHAERGRVTPLAEQSPAARELLERQHRTLPLAAQLGVPLLAGTDEQPHGSVALEVAEPAAVVCGGNLVSLA